jgi:hypothetical protein
VDASARAELQCIAAATGGTYADAQDAATLRDELTIRTTRAIGVYEAEVRPSNCSIWGGGHEHACRRQQLPRAQMSRSKSY